MENERENDIISPEEDAVDAAESVAEAEISEAESVEAPDDPVVPAEEPGDGIPDRADDTPDDPSFADEAVQNAESEAASTAGKGKGILKKWWFWLIIIAVIGGIITTVVLVTSSSGKHSDGSGGTLNSITVEDPYVKLVKTTKNSNYGITYGDAFNRFFTNPKWSYFKADSGENVVEFTGGFSYSGSPATAKIQFVIDVSENTLEVYHLSINGEAQNRLMLATLVKKVFESY